MKRRSLNVSVLLLFAATAVAPFALSQAPEGQPQGQGQQGQPQQGQRGGGNNQNQPWAAEKLAKSPRHKEWVKINAGNRTIGAWVISPETKKKVPVVIVLHEVFGLTDSTTNTADEISAMGYITIVPDMLSGLGPDGGGTASLGGKAGQMSTAVPDETVNTAINALADYGDKLPQSDGKLALVGLSWGGGAAFRFAAEEQRKDLKLVCVFYDVGPPQQTQGPDRDKNPPDVSVAKINVPVYGFYGETDTRPLKTLQATKDAMAAAGKKYDPVVYAGADHAYMRVGEDPNSKNPANAVAVKESLARLEKILKTM